MDSAVARDSVVNTWHFLADDPTVLEAGPVVQLTTFYDALKGYRSKAVNPAASWYRAYDLDDDEPRAPVLEEQFNSGTTATTAAPPELAICMSYEAPHTSGEPQRRRRGRIYLGPWGVNAIDTSDPIIKSSLMGDLVTATQNLLDASQAATTWSWQIYSRMNEASIEVVHAWVDNAWDIQRRRGVPPTVTTDVT